MSEKKVWIEQTAHTIALNMPDEFPDGFAYYLAEIEWEKRNDVSTD